MFKIDQAHRLDFWGFGFEASVQYDWSDETQTTKRATGVALRLSLITRELMIGYFWG